MDATIANELNQEQHTPFHAQILQDSKALLTFSRRKMAEYYAEWDKNDDVYRCLLKRDKEDVLASDRKEPEKMVVPISFAQIQTFVAFCYSLYSQRERMFELAGFTAEDERPAKIGEALLARDLAKNKFDALLVQWLLDIARFGVGVVKCSWVTEQKLVRAEVTTPGTTFLGMAISKPRTEERLEWATSYEGNNLTNISPYRFFPDTRLPLTRFQEGEFCASEDVYSVSQLKQWETEGVVAGVDFIPQYSKDLFAERGYRWDPDIDPGDALTAGTGVRGDGQAKRTVIITELQRTIIPSQYKVEDKPIGPETYPVKYNIWIANDKRIIKCEPMNYLHNEFTYAIGQYSYDNNVFVSRGLSDVIDQLQSVISWFVNSRITNVRKVIGDKLIVNTSMVNMTDLQQRRPVIRLTGAATGDIDRYIKQLPLQDVTTNHIADVKEIHGILKIVTGITDSLLGEVRPGRRSATENRNTTAGSANRLRTTAAVLFVSGLVPLARQMLSNLRDGLDEATFVRVMGMKGQATPEFIQVSKKDLVGHYDFEIFDGTLPSDRAYTAQALEDLVAKLGPQGCAMLGLDFKKLMMEALQLRGVRNPERFELTPEQQQQQQQQLLQQNANASAANPADGTSGASSPVGPTGPTSGVSGALQQSLLPSPAGGFGAGGNGGNSGGFLR